MRPSTSHSLKTRLSSAFETRYLRNRFVKKQVKDLFRQSWIATPAYVKTTHLHLKTTPTTPNYPNQTKHLSTIFLLSTRTQNLFNRLRIGTRPRTSHQAIGNTTTSLQTTSSLRNVSTNKHLPRLLSTQQEFLDTEPLDRQQRTLATCSITSLENPQRIHPISRQQLLHQQSKSIDPNMLNLKNLTETQGTTRNGKKTVRSTCSPTTTISQTNIP